MVKEMEDVKDCRATEKLTDIETNRLRKRDGERYRRTWVGNQRVFGDIILYQVLGYDAITFLILYVFCILQNIQNLDTLVCLSSAFKYIHDTYHLIWRIWSNRNWICCYLKTAVSFKAIVQQIMKITP